ncbi:MAG: thioredoxin family protein [Flavobacteriaceae bacterium]
MNTKEQKQIIVLAKITTMLCCMLFGTMVTAQKLEGRFSKHAQDTFILTGFNYYKSYELGKTTLDSLGNFTLTYPQNYHGMAILSDLGGARLVLVLDSTKTTVLKGTHLQEPDSLVFFGGGQNKVFAQLSKQALLNDRAYAGWRYLQKLYELPENKRQKKALKAIVKERHRIEKSFQKTRSKLADNSYLRWYAPLRKLVQDMPQTVRNYPERITKDIMHFRSIDFTNPNFKTSGLFNELIEGHYMLLENMGQSLDSIYAQMNKSTDYLIANLKTNDGLLNEVADNLFELFEKRSLFKVAAHMSDVLLNAEGCACKLQDSLTNKLQKYGRLKVGAIAPDLVFSDGEKLSEVTSPKLLVFGASWCPHCTKELKKLEDYVEQWKEQYSLTVFYVSLDTDKKAYTKTYGQKPWISYCDMAGWESPWAKAYYVNATPTYILLGGNNEILLHPVSLDHVNAWARTRLTGK